MRRPLPLGPLIGLSTLLIAIAACGGRGASVTQAQSSLSGTWSGTTQDSLAGSGSLVFVIQQRGSGLTGTWNVTYADPGFDGSGSVSGTVSGADVQMTFAPASPSPCDFFASATTNDMRDHAQGSYSHGTCLPAETATFTASRR